MISIIIPAYREPYLNRTIDSLLANCVGHIEIIPVIDCYPLDEPIRNDPRVKPIYLQKNLGMRGAINNGLAAATGDYIMKMDAHCAIGIGYDTALTEDCREEWLMIPRRYSLNETEWTPDHSHWVKDYHYLTFPGLSDPAYGFAFQVATYPVLRVNKVGVDDTMTFQGSCWLAHRRFFMDRVGPLNDKFYGTFSQEQQEIGLKYWLGGGAVKTTNKCWYGHLFKTGKHYAKAFFSRRHKKDVAAISGNEWATRHWMNNEEPAMIRPFSWLVEKFSPLPGWEEDWQERWARINEKPDDIRRSGRGLQPGA